ncbi:MAG: molecular chaperone DnaJ [Candidatus Omnitrophota bacterium]
MMSTQRDYYEILGVAKGASVEDIKKSYRQLAMKYHPDRVPAEQKKQAEEKFKEISEAYAVLSDSQKKKLYDQYGHAGIDAKYTTEDIFKGADFSSFFGSNGFGDIFEGLFGGSGGDAFGGGGRRYKRQGEDIQLQLSISLEEAGKGTEKDVTYYRHDDCSRCNGSGAEPGSSKVICAACRGSGTIRSGLGFISFSQTCPNCAGEGKIIKNRCQKCSGEGRLRGKKTLKVTIPKGVDTGSVLRLKNEGSFAGGARGDLYIYIKIKLHPVFIREAANIRCKVKVDITQVVLGSEIEAPTLEGKVKMKIPPGTQPNTVFRLKGKGIADIHTKYTGDEFIEVEVEVPNKLSSREKKLVEEWARLRRENI